MTFESRKQFCESGGARSHRAIGDPDIKNGSDPYAACMYEGADELNSHVPPFIVSNRIRGGKQITREKYYTHGRLRCINCAWDSHIERSRKDFDMFLIRQRSSTVGREILGGVTTFLAMSYIVFVQVGLLSSEKVGMDGGGVLMAMCIASAAACFLMALLANYPIALAPGMGENFFFVAIAGTIGGWGLASAAGWEVALALTAIGGAIFLALSFVGLRSSILNSIPDALKSGIAAGIGLLIARIGIENANLPAAYGDKFGGFLNNPAVWVALVGLAVTLALLAFKVRGAILVGILAATAMAVMLGKASFHGVLAMPGGLDKTVAGFGRGLSGVVEAFSSTRAMEMVAFLAVLLMMDLFDTVGTLVGVAGRAGLMKNGRLPRAERALAADAAGTVIGGCLGSSTVTSYVESVTGVESGARTGLAAIVTGLCLLGAMFCKPIVDMVMGEFAGANGAIFPTVAAALIVVGAMMLRAVREIDWNDATEFIPAFLTLLVMAMTYSIADGIAIGFVSYAFGKLVTGKFRKCPLMVYVFAVLFVLRYLIPSAS